MKQILVAVVSFSLLVAEACESGGFSPRETPVTTFTELVYGLQTTDSVNVKHKPIQCPIRLAVAQIGEISPPDSLVKAAGRNPNLVSAVLPLPLLGDPAKANPDQHNTYYSKNIDKLLGLARQMDASHILIIGGEVNSRTRETPLQILDIVLLPALFVPSNVVHVDMKANAALIEVDTRQLVTIYSKSLEKESWSPSAFAEQKKGDLALAQKDKIAEELATELEKQLILLSGGTLVRR